MNIGRGRGGKQVMNHKSTRNIFYSILTVLFLHGLLNAQDFVRVKRVVDGDTLALTNGEKVRLIGIDAPESRPNPRAEKQVETQGKDLTTIFLRGKAATRFVEGLVRPGDQVRLEFDV
jgi:endonuclease YncB( thermonuclease family)